MNFIRKIGCFIGLVATVAMLSQSVFASADSDNEKDSQVLFISSYSESFLSVPDQIEGIKEAFSGENVELDVEYMDTKHYTDQENLDNFHRSLSYKFAHGAKYDAIIVGDDAALQFAMDYRNTLFSGIPVVFLGINDLTRAQIAYNSYQMTGISEVTPYKETIEIAEQFNKKATRVLTIVDGTITGVGDEKQVEAIESGFPKLDFQILRASDYSFDEIGARLEQVKSDTIVLFISLTADKNGQYMDLNDQFMFMKTHSKVPVYRASVGGVGEGLMGGRMVDFTQFGYNAASTVLRILNGTPVTDIRMSTETPYFYCFDYNLIKQYHISEKLIPDDAVLINKEENPFARYVQYIWILAIIVGLLTVIATILIFDNVRRRRMQKELLASHEELQAIYEELTASEEELKNQYAIIEGHAREASNLYQKYETAISSTNSAVWEFHLESNIMELSSNIDAVLGKNVPLTGNAFVLLEKLMDEEYREEVRYAIREYIEGKLNEIAIEVPVLDEKGNRRWILIRGNAVYDTSGKMEEIYGIMLDITAQKEREAYVEFFAKHDFLTKLPNRMSFLEDLQKALHRSEKGALLIFDIDDFKSINDTLGHAFGDELLIQVSNRLDHLKDDRFSVARMGGDEFLILIRDVETEEAVEPYLDRIIGRLTEEFLLNGIREYVNCSMGITFYPKDSNNINQLLMNADTAMYKVKKNGKNNFAFYHEDMNREIKEKKEIETVLRQAAKNEDFTLLYQPQIAADTGQVMGFEALIRMKGYNVSPALFIPVAEDTGDIIEIGRWVAREAIRQIGIWKQMGLGEKTVAINYSGKQLRDRGYVEYLKTLFQEHQVSPESLEIEITEGILLENNDQTMEFLQDLKAAGISVALDDFGTGYSSLSYLTYLPVGKIKLDKSINDKFLEYEDIRVMDSIISLAHGLNLKITAEGIEEKDKFNRLKECGCDFIQGYLFSKPLDVESAGRCYNKIYEV